MHTAVSTITEIIVIINIFHHLKKYLFLLSTTSIVTNRQMKKTIAMGTKIIAKRMF